MKRGELEFLVQGQLVSLPVDYEYSNDEDPTGRTVLQIESCLLNDQCVFEVLVMDQLESLKAQARDDMERQADDYLAGIDDRADIAREFQREALAENENQRGVRL